MNFIVKLKLNLPQIKCIIGHEIGHAVLKAHMIPKSTKWKLLLFVSFLLVVWSSTFSFLLIDSLIWILTVLPLLLIIFELGLYISFKDEINADNYSVMVTNDPKSLLSALDCIDNNKIEYSQNLVKSVRDTGIIIYRAHINLVEI